MSTISCSSSSTREVRITGYLKSGSLDEDMSGLFSVRDLVVALGFERNGGNPAGESRAEAACGYVFATSDNQTSIPFVGMHGRADRHCLNRLR